MGEGRGLAADATSDRYSAQCKKTKTRHALTGLSWLADWIHAQKAELCCAWSAQATAGLVYKSPGA
jgi:hypothetical protein